jgi:RecA-family ATPase
MGDNIGQRVGELPQVGILSLSQVGRFYGAVRWAWPEWVPVGHVTLMVGPQGTGKSYLAASLAASMTGRLATWPDGCPLDGWKPGPVVLADTEEMRGATVQRMVAMGVRDGDVLFPSPDGDPAYIPRLPEDADLLARIARDQRCSAVVVDSLSGGHGLDENSAAMRQVLQSLVSMAGRLQVPVVAVHHTRKRSVFEPVRLSLDRVRGSSTITQFCRSVVGVYRLTDDASAPSRVESLKSSFAKPPEPFGFGITDDGLVFGDAPEEERAMTATDRAVEFLEVELRREPQRYSDLLSKAEAEGISKNTLYRARERLRVVTLNGLWALPMSSTHGKWER